jgi:membrane protease YdiL (CAAX protease family)
MVRRYVEVTSFVGIWMALGWGLSLDENAYLLLGVPLTLAFQVVVRRRPIAAMWVRGTATIRLSSVFIGVAAVIALTPALQLATSYEPLDRVGVIWLCCAVAGAIPAAFSIEHQQRGPFLRAIWPALIALAGGCLAVTLLHESDGMLGSRPMRTVGIIEQFLLYFPVFFAIEEVTFRGVMDAHLTSDDDIARPSAWGSAVFVSALWGLWHLPNTPTGDQSLFIEGPYSVALHCGIGVPLSFAWRLGGTLFLPALAHALIDAYRNGVLGFLG